jgi:hypothetical protein
MRVLYTVHYVPIRRQLPLNPDDAHSNDINPAVGIDRTVGSWWRQHNRRPL